ncbi:DUF3644 domain-containing protein [Cyanobacterium aponinum]|uniref:DUF3644 domain-containing protein n=1 Tax=Cyanobacterium aponinum TaxID=379064 RepID=UPI000C12D0AE|nr:DUF3644 domain-containing protein [Cyanobacterium aponinum]PHV61592.1 hypothetical protein CSQ80_14845 [Cyanobacterium aponinum IPPAS B-1201]
MKQRNRKTGSIKIELLTKSREAMLTAVQIFNNPNIQFKSENFIVLAIISWTYLLHAYYRNQNIEYRYYKMHGKRKKYDKTGKGAYKFWELERCLKDDKCPIDKVAKSNLMFLVGLRHEIEHQMTTRIDDYLSARFQACCLNYNYYIKTLFEEKFSIDKHLSFSLQFSSIKEEHVNQLKEFSDLPQNISAFINGFDSAIPYDEYNDMRYSYRVLYVPKSVNHKGQADKVIEFIPANSPEAKSINKEYVLIKEKEKPKYLPSQIVKLMQDKGYIEFKQYHHTKFWKSKDAKNKGKGFGVQVAKTWYWYESWLTEVEKHCQYNSEKYGKNR